VFTHTLAAGAFNAPFSQALADAFALSQCLKELEQRKICFGSAMLPACVDAFYEHTFTVTGGTAPYNIQISAASLPIGFTLDSATGYFSGTGVTAGTYTLELSLTDSASPPTVIHKNFTFYLAEITTASPMPNGTEGAAYSETLTETGAPPAHFWSITSGALPDGLTLNPLLGVISGTPTLEGTFTFEVSLMEP
jgi:hypothetical protein